MQNRPELYDSKGGVRQDFTDAELAQISPAIRPRFDALHAAAIACADGEQAIRDKAQAVGDAKADVSKKQKRLAEISRPPTFHDVWLASVGKSPPPPPPETVAKIESIQAAISAAQEVLALAMDDHAAAVRAVVPLRKAQAVAFTEYNAEFPARSAQEEMRAMAKSYRKPEPEQRQNLSMVDAIASGTKEQPHRRHAQAAPGYSFRRGGSTSRGIMAPLASAPRPKLPSEL